LHPFLYTHYSIFFRFVKYFRPSEPLDGHPLPLLCVSGRRRYDRVPPHQRVDRTYALFVQAVNNWSSVFGVWGLNIDGQLGASMQARLNLEVAAAESARSMN